MISQGFALIRYAGHDAAEAVAGAALVLVADRPTAPSRWPLWPDPT